MGRRCSIFSFISNTKFVSSSLFPRKTNAMPQWKTRSVWWKIQMSLNIVTVLCCYCSSGSWWGIWEPDKKMKYLTTVWLIGRYNTCPRYTLKRVLRYNTCLRYIEHWSDIGRYNTCLRYTLKRVLFLKAKICCPWLIRHQETDINDRDNICFRIRPL